MALLLLAGEGTLRWFIKLAEDSPALRTYCDLSRLKAALAASNNDFYVFEN